MTIQRLILAVFTACCFGTGVVRADGQKYIIDNELSYIHVFTGAAGFLKSISHTHLVSIRNISGEIVWDGIESQAELNLRPNDFLVDDEGERALSVDPDYRDAVSPTIQSGTRRNMLGDKLLEADLYPEILVRLTPISIGENDALVNLSISIKSEIIEIQKQIEVLRTDEQIRARADFILEHSELGLSPYSVLGLMRVADEMRFYIDIVATRDN